MRSWIDPCPDWMDKDGNILRGVEVGYNGTFTWITPAPFDILVHSTPARTKGHAFEIIYHEEFWKAVAMMKEDYRRQFFG